MGRVLAVGVFDIFQPGHLSYLQSCAALGDELIVLVARDIDVSPPPIVAEDSRVLLVDSICLVDAALLRPAGDITPFLHEIDPTVFAIEDIHAAVLDQLESRLATCGFSETRIAHMSPENSTTSPVRRASEAGVIQSVFGLDE